MKIFNIFLIVFLFISACKTDKVKDKTDLNPDKQENYDQFGQLITKENTMDAKEALTFYKNLTPSDTIPAKISARIKEVCQAKGCWMTLELPGGEQIRVTFKDYGFFVPKDVTGKSVIVEGDAYAESSSIETLQHFARDAGKSEHEVGLISKPEMAYSFEAKGVLIKE